MTNVDNSVSHHDSSCVDASCHRFRTTTSPTAVGLDSNGNSICTVAKGNGNAPYVPFDNDDVKWLPVRPPSSDHLRAAPMSEEDRDEVGNSATPLGARRPLLPAEVRCNGRGGDAEAGGKRSAGAYPYDSDPEASVI